MSLKPFVVSTSAPSVQEQKLDKRTKIIDAAASTFLRLGFGETSLDDIVEQSGVVKQTIYNYFENKEALFLAAVDYLLAKNSAELFPPELQGLEPKEFFEKIGKQLIKTITEPAMRDFLSLLVQECRRFPALQQIYAEKIPRPFVDTVKSYLLSRGTALSERNAETLSWAFRLSITGFATLSNLSGLLPYPVPNRSRYLQTAGSSYAALLNLSFNLAAGDPARTVTAFESAEDADAMTAFFQPQKEELGEKKLQIMQAAINLLSKKGLADTSMEEIAAQAKVSKQTVYKHFRSKNFLYSFLCKSISTELLAQNLVTEDCSLSEFVQHFFVTLSDSCARPWIREYLRMLFGEAKAFPVEAGTMLLFIIEHGRSQLESRLRKELAGSDIDFESASVILRCTMGSFILLNQIFVVAENQFLNQNSLLEILEVLVQEIRKNES